MRFKSLMFVPAVEKKLKKVPDLQADAFIIDLEYSINNNDKGMHS